MSLRQISLLHLFNTFRRSADFIVKLYIQLPGYLWMFYIGEIYSQKMNSEDFL